MNCLTNADERELHRLRSYLGASGILFPITVKQVQVFCSLQTSKSDETDSFAEADDILTGAYRTRSYHSASPANLLKDTESFYKAAARNGQTIPAEVLERMRRDRKNK
jgi:hypothetical protein